MASVVTLSPASGQTGALRGSRFSPCGRVVRGVVRW